MSNFTVAQKEVTPQINLISRKNTKNNEFYYLLDGKYKYMTVYFAIPDDVINTTSTEVSEIEFTSGVTVIYSVRLSATSGENQVVSFKVPLNEVNDLTIKVISEDANPIKNAVMWGITLAEVNTGQRVITV